MEQRQRRDVHMNMSSGNYHPFPRMVRLAAHHSLAAAEMVPTAEVELRNGAKSRKEKAIIDTGMNGTHLLIPSAIANELGIVPTGKEIQNTIRGQQEVLIGKIDLISIPGMQTCALANGKVTIGGDMVVLGQPFLAATGAAIIYGEFGAGLQCSGKPSAAVGVFPQFNFDIANKNRTETVTAVVDTGFYGDLGLPFEIATKLGLEKKSTQEVTTPQGKVNVAMSTVDRLSLSGHPLCTVQNAEVVILPENAPSKVIVVGEGFLEKLPKNGQIKAAVAYGKDGAVFVCAADKSKVPAAKSIYLSIISPEQPTLIAPERSLVPWVPIAALVAGGLGLWYFLSRRS